MEECLVYLDDVIAFSRTIEEHFEHLQDVLRLLEEAGVTLKLKKCQLFCDTVDYLGHVIRPGRLALAEKNTRALKEAKHPQTQTELWGFLGLATSLDFCPALREYRRAFECLDQEGPTKGYRYINACSNRRVRRASRRSSTSTHLVTSTPGRPLHL